LLDRQEEACPKANHRREGKNLGKFLCKVFLCYWNVEGASGFMETQAAEGAYLHNNINDCERAYLSD